MVMILEQSMLLSTNYYQKWKRVVFNSLNIQYMELLLLAQPIWVQVKGNQYWVNSPIFLRKELMKENLNRKQKDMDFRQEELEDNTHQWTKREQQISLQWQDLELHKPMLHKNFIMGLLSCIRLKVENIQIQIIISYF